MRNKWILLAEDDPNDAALTLTGLAKAVPKNSVVVANDGSEALDYLYSPEKSEEAGHCPPALVLLDIKMPKADGIEVLRRIKADPELKWIPVVMFTSSRQESDMNLCYNLGANAYIVKPVNFTEFREAIRCLALFWITINELPPKNFCAPAC